HDRVVDGAWLSLEARDNEPGRFAALVAHALRLEALGPQRRSRRGDALAIDRVLEALEAAGVPRVLVLDDAHELTAPEALQALAHARARALAGPRGGRATGAGPAPAAPAPCRRGQTAPDPNRRARPHAARGGDTVRSSRTLTRPRRGPFPARAHRRLGCGLAT